MTDYCQGKINGDPPYYIRRPCSRKAVRDGFCGVHHPDAEAARRKRSSERGQAAHEGRMKEHARKFTRPTEYREVLKLIAGGAPNAREIARDILRKWDEE